MIKKTIVTFFLALMATIATAQIEKTDSCIVAENKIGADEISNDQLTANNDTVSIMFRNNQPQHNNKVNFKTPKHDPFKEKMRNLNLSETVRGIIRR